MENLISVIIPVYNSVPWLRRCLDSVVGQTLRFLEIICVDDASTDGSSLLLDGYAASDSRVRIIRFTENRGVTAARNAGLEAAEAPWLFFLDSDDWIDPGYLEAMLGATERNGAEPLNTVINGNWLREWENGSRVERGEYPSFFTNGFYPSYLVQSYFNPILCVRLYRKAFLDGNGIDFPSFHGAEDIYFCGLADALSKECFIFQGPCYHYSQRAASVSHDREFRFHCMESFKALYDALREREVPIERLRLFCCGTNFEVGSETEFRFLKSYFEEIAPYVRQYPVPYSPYDRGWMNLILKSADYDELKALGKNRVAKDLIDLIRARRSQNNAK